MNGFGRRAMAMGRGLYRAQAGQMKALKTIDADTKLIPAWFVFDRDGDAGWKSCWRYVRALGDWKGWKLAWKYASHIYAHRSKSTGQLQTKRFCLCASMGPVWRLASELVPIFSATLAPKKPAPATIIANGYNITDLAQTLAPDRVINDGIVKWPPFRA
jgi:hypothetical protein